MSKSTWNVEKKKCKVSFFILGSFNRYNFILLSYIFFVRYKNNKHGHPL